MSGRSRRAPGRALPASLALLALLAPAALAVPTGVAARLKLVATLPDLADIAAQIGGERVEVTALCRGRENLHAVQPRPSHLVALSRADLFVQVGLSLEASFVPGLLESARNAKVKPGGAGFVDCSVGWEALDVPESLSRQQGDLHPQGNPHLNLDPRGGRHIAARILEGLLRVDPGSREHYEQRARAWLERLDAAEKRWGESAKACAGRKVVTYHKEFDYLARALSLEIVGTIESRPGIPPTPNHLAELIVKLRRVEGVVILTAPWSNDAPVARLSEQTGARVVELPSQCGAYEAAQDWISMMDLIHARLERAFGPPPREQERRGG